jgi:mRNA-degrading endonuclease RelE of RelBE toxin-antitoxin system
MKARVRLIDQALEEYKRLKKTVKEEEKKGINSSENQTLWRSINQKIEWLKKDPLKGEVVSKKDIPKELDVDNLFKLRLAKYWRMLFTIRRQEIEIICFVLVIESHPDYDKRFKIKKK